MTLVINVPFKETKNMPIMPAVLLKKVQKLCSFVQIIPGKEEKKLDCFSGVLLE